MAPALDEVGEALRAEGVDAVVEHGVDFATTIPYVTLTERMDGERDFTYQVYPVAWPTPGYLLSPARTEDNYYRLEPFALTGSRGYDVYGYTKEQLIHDVLDNHERHIEFIRISGPTVEEAGSTEIIGSSVATTDWSMDFTAPLDVPVADHENTENSATKEGNQ